MSSVPLIERSYAQHFYRKLFEALYGVPSPLLSLERILHWVNITRELGCLDLEINRAPTWIFGGYFFNTTSSMPDEQSLDSQMAMGRAHGAMQFLIPTVRESSSCQPLLDRGFRPLPWFVESIFEIQKGLDQDLCERLGKKRHKEILRLWRKAETDYYVEQYTAVDLRVNPSVLRAVSELHRYNVDKYKHAFNFYSEEALLHLLASRLGDHLLICLRRDRETHEPVQTSISLVDTLCGQMYQLVQGIARDRVRAGQNLYIADTYHLYCLAEAKGITEINLGRGGPDQKSKLGANRFHMLINWLRSDILSASDEMNLLTQLCHNANRFIVPVR